MFFVPVLATGLTTALSAATTTLVPLAALGSTKAGVLVAAGLFVNGARKGVRAARIVKKVRDRG